MTRRELLDEGSPAGHIEHLDPSANGQNGDASTRGLLKEERLGGVAIGVDATGFGGLLGTISIGLCVSSARQ